MDDEVCVDVTVANLEGRVAEWVTIFHGKGVPKLRGPGHVLGIAQSPIW